MIVIFYYTVFRALIDTGVSVSNFSLVILKRQRRTKNCVTAGCSGMHL